MDILAIKEAFEWFLLRACFVSLAGFITLFILLKVGSLSERIKTHAKRHGWPVVILFFIWSVWATYTSFPTSEEKREYQEQQRQQEALNKAWGDMLVGEWVSGGVCDNNVANVGMLPIINTNSQPAYAEATLDKLELENETGNNGNTGNILSTEDFARGFVLTQIGIGEIHDFTPKANAIIQDDWLDSGAATVWFYPEINDWYFAFGTNDVNRVRVHADAQVDPLPTEENVYFAPFKTSLGIVPQVNWSLLDEDNRPSCFWHEHTPSNTLLLTWQNALYNRATNMPVSIQMEVEPSGSFIYRYDLSKANLWSDTFPTNILVGAFNGALHQTVDISSLTNLTSLTFKRLDQDGIPGSDRDNDGLTIEDELFVYHTNPYNADSDYDGLCDSDEIQIYDTDPLNSHSSNSPYYDELAIKLGGLDPLSVPQNSTNTVLEHIFYTGSLDGIVTYPQSSDQVAVLKVSVTGSGSGRLVIGDKVVPLIPSTSSQMARGLPSPTILLVELIKGVTHKILFFGDASLNIFFQSDDFAFGNIAFTGVHRDIGYINFPNTVATIPCIHDFNARKTNVYLPASEGANSLIATWQGNDKVEVENHHPRSALITGNFSAKETRGITYTLTHPLYLFGQTVFNQIVRFCPVPPPEEDSEDGDYPAEPPWYTDGDGDNSDENDDEHNEHWCCYWGECGEWCDCGCDCLPDEDGSLEDGNENFDEECPEHGCSYEECIDSHNEEYAEAKEGVQHLGGVLYIRDPPQYETLHLDVPTEHRNCCPCPEHWTNYVSIAYKSYRLRLIDFDGKSFSKTQSSCDVRLAGVYPSSAVGDAQLAFSRNGEIYQQHEKTVLGVAIKGEYDCDLSLYNSLNRTFGYPMTIATNQSAGAQMRLVTNVKLPSGKIRLQLADTTGKFIVWYYDYYSGEYRKLLDSETMSTKNLDLSFWRKIMKRAGDGNSPELPIYITSSECGRTKLLFTYWTVIDGKFVEDTAYQYITSLKPPLRVDVSRDGSIDDGDHASWLESKPFYYWTNEDDIKGDYVGDNDDKNLNAKDLVVNGTYDLVNFFPIALDFQQFKNAWGNNVKYVLKAAWDEKPSFNFCFANLPWTKAGSIQTTNVTTMAETPLSSAQLCALSMGGVELPYDLLTQFSQDSGLMICEALEPYRYIFVDIKLGDKILYSYVLPMAIRPVKEMYNWYNFRHFSGDNSGRNTEFHTLWDEDYNKSLIFLHGANVSSDDAEKWGDAIFKRMWLSGMKARFYNVDWRSNIGSSANYHENASNAFVVASQIASTINNIPGEKVIMAHSLGNMVVSSMIQDYGLQVSKYLMCNSAVPAEAYDQSMSLRVPQLVHPDWEEYPTNSWASSWYSLFVNEPNDDRKFLGWAGRFSGVLNVAVNFYSASESGGDEVLELAVDNNVDIFTGITSSFSHHAWHKQELFKGRGIGVGAGATDWSGWNIEENFLGVNKISVEEALGMSDTDFKTNTVFYCYPSSMNQPTIPLLVRGAHLAIGIPALTPATGASGLTMALGASRNCNLDNIDEDTGGLSRPNGWPYKSSYPNRWLHSDIKDVSYFYNFRFYLAIIMKGNLQ